VQETGLIFTRQVQDILGSLGANVQCFRAELCVVERAGRGREVKEEIDCSKVERLTDVPFYQGEPRLVAQPGQVGGAAGGKIIHANNMLTLANQCIAQMGSEEAGGAGDQDTMSRQNTVPLGLELIRV
jgi:hypothetical protein